MRSAWFFAPTILAVAAAALAAPPPPSFLTPNKLTVARGDSIELRFATGTAKAAQAAAWPDDVDWLFVRGGPTHENRHAVRPQRSGENFVAVKIEHAGVTVVGADRRPTVSEMTGAELRAFVEANVADANALEAARALPADRRVRVRCVTSTKALIRVATAGRPEPSTLATRKTGQAVELRPILDPTAVTPGSDIPLVTFIDNVKREGMKVQATHVATGKTSSFVIDASGSGYFRMSDPGLWRVEFHHAEPLADTAAADWVIYSATLAFEAGKGAVQ